MRPKLVLAVAVLALGASMFVANPAFAEKGGKGKGNGTSVTASSGIQLDQADPHLRDRVTFTITGGSRIVLACYQDSVGLVYSASQAVGTEFLLGGTSSLWLSRGGSADCYAYLYDQSPTSTFVAATRFTAGG